MMESGQPHLLTAADQPWRWPRTVRETEGQTPAVDSAPATLLDVSSGQTVELPVGTFGWF